MDNLFYWTGVVVWAAIAILFFWQFVWELIVVGLATSISYHRWSLSAPESQFKWRKHGPRLLWSVISTAFTYWGYRNDGSLKVTNTGNGAQWRGIGDWDKQ